MRPRSTAVKDATSMSAGRGVDTRKSLVAVWPASCTRGCGPWATTVNWRAKTNADFLAVENSPMAQ